jgi:hypothetical protein
MIVLYLSLLKKTKINGITLFPFIILRDKKLRANKVLMNHEKIHTSAIRTSHYLFLPLVCGRILLLVH